MISSISTCVRVYNKQNIFLIRFLIENGKGNVQMEIFPRLLYEFRKHRGRLSSSSRESVKQTSLSAKKKKTLFIQKSPPASFSSLHLVILKRKNPSYFRAFSIAKKNKVNFPESKSKVMLRKCCVDFCRNYRGNWKKDSRTKLRVKVISQHLSTCREIASSYMIFKTTTNLVLLNNLLPTYPLKGLFKA